GIAIIGFAHWIRTMSEEKLHEFGVARLCGPDKRRSTGLKKPLHRENGSSERVVLHSHVGVCSMVEQELDVLEIVHVRLRNRKIAAFDIAVVDGEIKRR